MWHSWVVVKDRPGITDTRAEGRIFGSIGVKTPIILPPRTIFTRGSTHRGRHMFVFIDIVVKSDCHNILIPVFRNKLPFGGYLATLTERYSWKLTGPLRFTVVTRLVEIEIFLCQKTRPESFRINNSKILWKWTSLSLSAPSCWVSVVQVCFLQAIMGLK